MFGSSHALTRPLLHSATSAGSASSSELEDPGTYLPAPVTPLACDDTQGSDAGTRDAAASQLGTRRWPWRRPRFNTASPSHPPCAALPALQASLPQPTPPAASSSVASADSNSRVVETERKVPGPGHTLGTLVGVLGCGLVGAIFGLQYAGRVDAAYAGLSTPGAFGVDTRWMYLPVVFVFGAKAACFGWSVAQLHQWNGWHAPGIFSATTRNIQRHTNSALRPRLHRRLVLGVAVGVAQAAFCGWHYASLHNGGWRMAVFPYLLPVIDLPATWATVRCLFVPLADACSAQPSEPTDLETGHGPNEND